MEIDKQKIISTLKDRGETDKASQADKELPEKVDTNEHKGMLDKLGIDVSDLAGNFSL